jgi:predicted amidohydrolase YtcJ
LDEDIKVYGNMVIKLNVIFLYLFFLTGCTSRVQQPADLIFFNGNILTVDEDFSIVKAVAIKDGKFSATGDSDDILKLVSNSTRKIDLEGRTVVPGIIENHAHPIGASQSELNEKIPDLKSIDDLLTWIHRETDVKNDGEWVIHPKFFSTRMKELRQPTIEELDSVAPNNPVFLNGSYGGMINTKAYLKSGLSNVNHPGIMRDKLNGKPTGFIRSSAFKLLAIPYEEEMTLEEQSEALKKLFALYNALGITSVCDGLGSPQSLKLYEHLREKGELSVRINQNMHVPFDPHGPLEQMRETLQQFGYKTGDGDEWIKIGALKIILDGGILTGTAFLRDPWGAKANEIFEVNDVDYRGELNYTREELINIITAATEAGWKFTAHVTGGGGVDILLSAMEEVNKSRPIQEYRNSLIHGNFFTPDAIEKMIDLGVYADMQPAWFYKDTDFLNKVLGMDRLKSFHPYNSLFKAGIIVNGGSDHMVKLDSDASINPYNPFLAIWSIITRKTERGSVFYPEEALSREQAIKMYTINNAYASFEEDIKGSIEVGKLADMAVLSDNILTCPVDDIKDIKAEITVLDGEIVYSRK